MAGWERRPGPGWCGPVFVTCADFSGTGGVEPEEVFVEGAAPHSREIVVFYENGHAFCAAREGGEDVGLLGEVVGHVVDYDVSPASENRVFYVFGETGH